MSDVTVLHREQDINKFGKYIINIDKPINPGTHWVALVYNTYGRIYFDPLGSHPLTRYLPCIYNNHPVQSFFSKSCGYFCIEFCKYVKDMKSFQDFLFERYTFDVEDNERKIHKLYM